MTIDLDEGLHRWTWIVPVGNAVKWDAKGSFYCNKFQGVHAKAVDFVGVANNELWLVEAKDFAIEPRDPEKAPLHEEFAYKVRDTLAGLVAASVAADDPNEVRLAQTALRTSRIRAVFQFWQPPHPSSAYGPMLDGADFKAKAKTMLNKFAPQPKVICGDAQLTDGVPWTNCRVPQPNTPENREQVDHGPQQPT